MNSKNSAEVLQVENLAISYFTQKGQIRAVRDVTFSIKQGETFGLVGESGSGKSTVAFSIVNFLGRSGKIVGGRIFFESNDITDLEPQQLQRFRGNKVAMVYQDPFQALNPSLAIGDQLREILMIHKGMKIKEAEDLSVYYLKRVYISDPEVVMKRYPHQLSGGQQQRVTIAMALLSNPALLIMDEPTTALDVTVEATVLDLVAELKKELKTATLYITHDLGVVAMVADSVGVMYAGEIVEHAAVDDIFKRPLHPYTKGLMNCFPNLSSTKASSKLDPIRGQIPAPGEITSGCIFQPRCDFTTDLCKQTMPEYIEINPGRFVRCHRASHFEKNGFKKVDSKTAEVCIQTQQREPILVTKDVKKYYRQENLSFLSFLSANKYRYIKAVDGVNLKVPRGTTLGIVGESGCGKSTLARTIVGLESLTDGNIELMGIDISAPVGKRELDLIKNLQMVFQNPDSTLNPSLTIGYQIARPIRRFTNVPSSQVYHKALQLLREVRLDESYYNRLPYQLSGGEKQRIAIARALASNPGILICDEPLSALDASVQAAIINQIVELQRKSGITMLFIAHDLSVVRYISDYVAVMYLGRICEIGPAESTYMPPYHPYTEALLSAIPIPDPGAKQRRIRLSGAVPSSLDPPTGCRFHTRCPRILGEICIEKDPPQQMVDENHFIFCHIPLDKLRSVEPVVMQTQEAD